MLTEIHKRIVNSKYILERALSAMEEGHEMSTSIAVLLAHDAIEMLMLAVSDHVGAKVGRNFMDFWQEVKLATSKEPPDRQSMKSLNELRVSLKHHGIQPHDQTAREHLVRSKGFFENLLSSYCELEYEDVSLLGMIADSEVISLITKAEDSFNKNEPDSAMMHLKFAFYKIANPEGKYLPILRAPSRPRIPHELNSSGIGDFLSELNTFLHDSATTMNASLLKINRLSYDEYLKTGPSIVWSWAGTPQVVFMQSFVGLTDERFRAWRDFIVDYALKAQAVYLTVPEVWQGRQHKRQYFIEERNSD